MTVTSQKLVDLQPTWRRYAGLSVLYDNPGTVLSPGLQRIDALPVGDGNQQTLYDALDAVTDELAGGPLRRFGFGPLPRATYHVTVCDGVNQTELDDVAAAHRPAVEALLDGLPDTLLRPSLPLHLLRASDLLPVVWSSPCTLRVRELWVGGHVLAAGLVAADERSAAALEAHAQARERLVAQLASVLGVSTQAWRPHVSLGYFANRQGAAAADEVLAASGGRALGRTEGLSVTFRSAAVYGFTDMATYWRAAV